MIKRTNARQWPCSVPGWSNEVDKTSVFSRREFLVGSGTLAGTTLILPSQSAVAATTVVRDVTSYQMTRSLLTATYPFGLIDIRADWCPPCITMERDIFPHKDVKAALKNVALIKIDVTEMNSSARHLLSLLRADGPPALFVIDMHTGREQPSTRLVGSIERDQLLLILQPFRST
ncbi:thioredoxin family protein [Agrobacterium tumefaciens]|uniref:thioredoxin family protein n=1 Tax=Agrobacterium tumefaciens TaxID=358 RepID=UPI0021D1209B|nr:thioredoxin family protein [Agrobacterium tumefaciens]UXS05404.1 hypothetical protein FY156_28015 [Agrobacterium tumefaciens]